MNHVRLFILASAAIALSACATVPSAQGASSEVRRSFAVPVPEAYGGMIAEAAAAYRIDPELLATVAYKESRFNPRAVSPRGAQGLMQLMPRTARYLGVTDAFDPRQNLLGGSRYLREMLDEFGGNVDLALAAYNAGPQAVKKAGLVPPTAEADEYVRFIRARYHGSGESTAATIAAR